MKKGDPGVELAVGTTIISTAQCGVVSIILTGDSTNAAIILTGDSTNAASIKLYDHAVSATGSVIRALAIKTEAYAVYCPCKPDAFMNGVVAVVAGTGAKGYVSVEP